jgi:RNase P/RNase MRP subunit POP5
MFFFVSEDEINEFISKSKLERIVFKYFIDNLGEYVKSRTNSRLGYFIKDGVRTAEIVRSHGFTSEVLRLGIIDWSIFT